MFFPTTGGSYVVNGDQSYFLPYFSGPGPPSPSAKIPELLQDEPAIVSGHLSRAASPDNAKPLNFGINQILGNDTSDSFPSNSTGRTGSSERYAMAILALQHRILQEACSLDLKSYIRKNMWKFDFPTCLPFANREIDSQVPYAAENSTSCNTRKESSSESPASDSSEEEDKGNRRGMLKRAVFSDRQKHGLEERFQIRKYISKFDRKTLSEKLSLKDSQVKVWFQNRRMKCRNSKDKTLTIADAEASL